MALKNVEVIEKQENHEKSWFKRFNKKWATGTTAVATYALVPSAHAAEDLSAVGTAITGQLSSSGTIIVTILIAAATLTALIIGYKKLNAGAKAA